MESEMLNMRPTGRESDKQVPEVEASEQPEEVVVPDVRNDLTPSQMVDAKLLVLLGHIPPGRFGDCRHHSRVVRPGQHHLDNDEG
jgi:hypothetical protein